MSKSASCGGQQIDVSVRMRRNPFAHIDGNGHPACNVKNWIGLCLSNSACNFHEMHAYLLKMYAQKQCRNWLLTVLSI